MMAVAIVVVQLALLRPGSRPKLACVSLRTESGFGKSVAKDGRSESLQRRDLVEHWSLPGVPSLMVAASAFYWLGPLFSASGGLAKSAHLRAGPVPGPTPAPLKAWRRGRAAVVCAEARQPQLHDATPSMRRASNNLGTVWCQSSSVL